MTRKMTSLPNVTVFTVPDGNYDNNVVLPKNLIVIHTEDGFKQGTEARFTNPQSHVSAQYGVNQDGTYDEYVDEDQVAYHAGNYEVNQRSIGIEHEDFGKPNDPRPDILYTASAKLVHDICQFWGIPIDRQHIVKHSEVSQLGTACPDGLDIDRIIREANLQSQPTTDSQKVMDDLRAARDNNWNLYQEEITKNTTLTNHVSDLQVQLDNQKNDYESKLADLQGQVNDYKQKYEDEQKHTIELNTELAAANTQMAQIKAESKDYAIQTLDAQHQADAVQQQLQQTQQQQAKQVESALQLFINKFIHWKK